MIRDFCINLQCTYDNIIILISNLYQNCKLKLRKAERRNISKAKNNSAAGERSCFLNSVVLITNSR